MINYIPYFTANDVSYSSESYKTQIASSSGLEDSPC